MRRAAAGEGAASRILVQRVGPSMLRLVRSILGPEHPDIEDIVQEALLGLLTSAPSFRGECSTVHFACRIAARAALAARRRNRAAHVRLDELQRFAEPLETDGAMPDDEALAMQRRKLLRALLDELPEAQAESLVLRILLGLSLDEVAKATGAPLNTVRSRLRLAKEALARRIAADPKLAEELEVAG